MSLSFPLGLADFLDRLPIAEVAFRLGSALEFSETGDGEIISHDIGARLWEGEIVLDRARHDELQGVEARLGYLHRAAGSFLVRDTRVIGPLLDPTGSELGTSSPTLNEVGSDGLTVTIGSVPLNYTLSEGDYIAFTYGSNPTRYALHRALQTVKASGFSTIQISNLPVDPPVREGVSTPATVSFLAPVCKARLIEADYGRGRSVISQGGVIKWRQTLR